MKYFIAAGHVPGAGATGQGFEEGALAVKVANALTAALKGAGHSVLEVPNALDLAPSIAWVNDRCVSTDRALELHFNKAPAPQTRGSLVAVTASSRPWASPLIRALSLHGIPPWGAGVMDEADVAAWHGWPHLGWCHDTRCSAALLELGFISNAQDDHLWATPEHRQHLVAALAEKL